MERSLCSHKSFSQRCWASAEAASTQWRHRSSGAGSSGTVGGKSPSWTDRDWKPWCVSVTRPSNGRMNPFLTDATLWRAPSTYVWLDLLRFLASAGVESGQADSIAALRERVKEERRSLTAGWQHAAMSCTSAL